MSEILRLENISKKARSGPRDIDILHPLTLVIESGEFLAITGPSGSGKSTLLNLMGLLDHPTSGSIQFLGHETTVLSPTETARLRACSIGFIFQSFHLISHLTVRQNIALPLAYAGRRDQMNEVDRLLDRFHLTNHADAFPATLSGGEKQRVAIARAIINKPPLLLADEPTGALDSENSREVLHALQELHNEGKTVILITHEMTLTREAGRLLKLRDGQWEAAA